MNIIVTPKYISKVELDQLDDSSSIFLLYEPDEVVAISDIAVLYDNSAKILFVPVDSRDDKLLCIGGIKARMDCMIVDEDLEYPDSVLDKLNGVFDGRKIQQHPKEKRSDKVTKESVKRLPSQFSGDASGDAGSKMTVAEMEKRAKGEGGPNLTKRSRLLYDLIGLSASDVGFTLGTDALMQAIASIVNGSGGYEECERKISEMDNGELIWSRMEPELGRVREICAAE